MSLPSSRPVPGACHLGRGEERHPRYPTPGCFQDRRAVRSGAHTGCWGDTPWCPPDTHPPSRGHPPGVLLTPQEGIHSEGIHKEGRVHRSKKRRNVIDAPAKLRRLPRQHWPMAKPPASRRSGTCRCRRCSAGWPACRSPSRELSVRCHESVSAISWTLRTEAGSTNSTHCARQAGGSQGSPK